MSLVLHNRLWVVFVALAGWSCSAPETTPARPRAGSVAAVDSSVPANVRPSALASTVASALPEASGAPLSSEPPEDDMVTVSGGSFTMGCGKADLACLPNEKPTHPMLVRPFMIDRLEVTVDDYMRCVRAGVCAFPPTIRSYERCVDSGRCPPPRSNGVGICNASDPSRGAHPINCIVTGRDYCKWLGKRLPTATEWERAARGADGRTFPWGSEAPSDRRLCWMQDATCPVGSFPEGASPFGALDMAGNVAELVDEQYPSVWNPLQYQVAGPDGERSTCSFAKPCTSRGVRGGDYTPGADVRSSARGTDVLIQYDLPMVGFRCVRDVK